MIDYLKNINIFEKLKDIHYQPETSCAGNYHPDD